MSITIPNDFEEQQYDPGISSADQFETFLIRVPQGFDIKKLDKKTFSTNHVSDVLNDGEGNGDMDTLYQVIPHKSENFGIRPLLLSVDKKVTVGDDIKGILSVTKSYQFKINHDCQSVPAPGPVPMPQGLRPRFSPFGASWPLKKKKSKKRKLNISVAESEFGLPSDKKLKRQKKHKKNKNDESFENSHCKSDVSLMLNPEEIKEEPLSQESSVIEFCINSNVSDSVLSNSGKKHKKHKKHKHKSDESGEILQCQSDVSMMLDPEEIKDEPLSQESSLTSSGKKHKKRKHRHANDASFGISQCPTDVYMLNHEVIKEEPLSQESSVTSSGKKHKKHKKHKHTNGDSNEISQCLSDVSMIMDPEGIKEEPLSQDSVKVTGEPLIDSESPRKLKKKHKLVNGVNEDSALDSSSKKHKHKKLKKDKHSSEAESLSSIF